MSRKLNTALVTIGAAALLAPAASAAASATPWISRGVKPVDVRQVDVRIDVRKRLQNNSWNGLRPVGNSWNRAAATWD